MVGGIAYLMSINRKISYYCCVRMSSCERARKSGGLVPIRADFCVGGCFRKIGGVLDCGISGAIDEHWLVDLMERNF